MSIKKAAWGMSIYHRSFNKYCVVHCKYMCDIRKKGLFYIAGGGGAHTTVKIIEWKDEKQKHFFEIVNFTKAYRHKK